MARSRPAANQNTPVAEVGLIVLATSAGGRRDNIMSRLPVRMHFARSASARMPSEPGGRYSAALRHRSGDVSVVGGSGWDRSGSLRTGVATGQVAVPFSLPAIVCALCQRRSPPERSAHARPPSWICGRPTATNTWRPWLTFPIAHPLPCACGVNVGAPLDCWPGCVPPLSGVTWRWAQRPASASGSLAGTPVTQRCLAERHRTSAGGGLRARPRPR